MSFNHSEDYYLKILFEKTKVSEIMVSPVITIQDNDKLSHAVKLFTENKISHLIAVNNDKKVVGILTPKYLYKAISPRKIIDKENLSPALGTIIDGDAFYIQDTLDSFYLRDIIKRNPITLTPQDSMADVISNMAEHKLSCIPIVDKFNKIQGVITDKDVVGLIAKIVNEK